ncbi:hypothetical protein [Nitrosarchaeum sp.]|uniref:hypothetical protein n=1 Tax=Nitrosarchaeum sp. TaxID=2026886 RepID=UPI00247D5967|nr:hypothetical protein [Nitrosarchaeum sp.]MCV0411785.1 hypothetical protein [Nitrosarchaeum sp.]
MKNTVLLPIVVGIGIILVFLGITSSQLTVEPILREPTVYQKLNFSYVDSNSILKSSLASDGILMSSPLTFTGSSIAKYCTFYQDEIKQNSINYCTSTELKDHEGNFLGNIHMVGTLDYPDAVLGVIQTDPYLSNLDSLKTTYQIMINSLVCDCWQDKKPGNFESISQWIDAAKSHHLEAKRTTSSSEISGLADKQLFLEITTNSDGYLWKLIISN